MNQRQATISSKMHRRTAAAAATMPSMSSAGKSLDTDAPRSSSVPHATAATMSAHFPFLDLPTELQETIIGCLSFDNIAQLRLVSRSFNRICSQLLNRGFFRAERFHSQCLKKVKAQLPRRESERRSHPLARHCEILSAIETRLSLLSMTYTRYMEANLCCFIPGKVVDEIFRVLRIIQNNANPPRIPELLQELRDISSMAIEFFEEKIVPGLKSKLNSNSLLYRTSSSIGYSSYPRPMLSLPTIPAGPSYSHASSPSSASPASSSTHGRHDFSKLQKTMTDSNARTNRELKDTKTKLKEVEKQVKDLNQTITELQTQVFELRKRLVPDVVMNEPAESAEPEVQDEAPAVVNRKRKRQPKTKEAPEVDNEPQVSKRRPAKDTAVDKPVVRVGMKQKKTNSKTQNAVEQLPKTTAPSKGQYAKQHRARQNAKEENNATMTVVRRSMRPKRMKL